MGKRNLSLVRGRHACLPLSHQISVFKFLISDFLNLESELFNLSFVGGSMRNPSLVSGKQACLPRPPPDFRFQISDILNLESEI